MNDNNKLLVGAAGFEPAASCSQSRRATKLRYAPVSSLIIIGSRFFNWAKA